MSLFYCSLNSGSNGNCFYIGNQEDAVLIDAGLSCKETEKRMGMLDLKMNLVKAVFITHEHIDHVKGMEMLAKKYNLPVFISTLTLQNSRVPLPAESRKEFSVAAPTIIGKMKIHAVRKFHDAADPYSFVVEQDEWRIGVFTDLGHICNHVSQAMLTCQVLFLESNYDVQMLEEGPYPYHLKKRISDSIGHLSNTQALDWLKCNSTSHLKHLLPAHISAENNHPEKVRSVFEEQFPQLKISLAGRHAATPLFSICDLSIKKAAPEKTMQLNLF